jgi:F-type H+-transporting ATPase subunit b
MDESYSVFSDTSFWILLSTLVFFFVVYKSAGQSILGALDKRSHKIKHDLDEAERLHHEARELLADYKKKHADAVKTAEEIIAHAQKTAQDIEKSARAKLEENLKRREEQVVNRIKLAEEAALNDLRKEAGMIAIQASRALISEQMKTAEAAESINQAIAKIK